MTRPAPCENCLYLQHLCSTQQQEIARLVSALDTSQQLHHHQGHVCRQRQNQLLHCQETLELLRNQMHVLQKEVDELHKVRQMLCEYQKGLSEKDAIIQQMTQRFHLLEEFSQTKTHGWPPPPCMRQHFVSPPNMISCRVPDGGSRVLQMIDQLQHRLKMSETRQIPSKHYQNPQVSKTKPVTQCQPCIPVYFQSSITQPSQPPTRQCQNCQPHSHCQSHHYQMNRQSHHQQHRHACKSCCHCHCQPASLGYCEKTRETVQNSPRQAYRDEGYHTNFRERQFIPREVYREREMSGGIHVGASPNQYLRTESKLQTQPLIIENIPERSEVRQRTGHSDGLG